MDGVDIITKVFMMASQMAMPREVHLEAVLYVYESLCQKYNSRMSFDPTYSAINMSDFKDCKWKEFYGELKKATPPNTPEKMGKEVDLCGYASKYGHVIVG